MNNAVNQTNLHRAGIGQHESTYGHHRTPFHIGPRHPLVAGGGAVGAGFREMKLLPYDVFTLRTEQSIPDLLKRIRSSVSSFRSLPGKSVPRIFEGRVTNEGFMIRRIVRFVTMFMPSIHGRFQPQENSTEIHVQLAPQPLLLAAIAFVFAMLGMLVFTREWKAVVLWLALSICIAWLTAICGFWLDRGKSRQSLTALLAEDPVQAQSASE